MVDMDKSKEEEIDNITDFEIRILGKDIPSLYSETPNSNNNKFNKWVIIALFAIAIAFVCFLATKRLHTIGNTEDTDELCDPTVLADTTSIETITEKNTVETAYATIRDTIVNDIELKVYTPHGGRMELYIGKHPEKDGDVFLAAHAADIRADMDAPTGAFVYKGELISKGHSKYGFCAIIGEEISIGCQRETPFLERAIEQNGSFFRQYSLVSNGKLVKVPPKGKSTRRALCLKEGQLSIYETGDAESYHDFSQALEDIGITEAIALVGGQNTIVARDKDGNFIEEEITYENTSLHENFVVWRK